MANDNKLLGNFDLGGIPPALGKIYIILFIQTFYHSITNINIIIIIVVCFLPYFFSFYV